MPNLTLCPLMELSCLLPGLLIFLLGALITPLPHAPRENTSQHMTKLDTKPKCQVYLRKEYLYLTKIFQIFK